MNRWRKDRQKTPPQTRSQQNRPKPELPRQPRFSARALLRPFAAFAAALRFLTIVPLPGGWGTAEKDLAHAAPFFPLVGLLLGCAAAPAAQLLFFLFPPLPAAALTVFVLLAFSGALHLDGLADTADGFFSARTKERILEIMKDSSIGTMGALALILIVLLKTVSLASLYGYGQGQPAAAVLLMPLAGRTAIVLFMALLPYPREQGLGRLFALYFHSSAGKAAAAAGFLLCVFAAHAVAGTQGLTAVLVMLVPLLVFALFCQRKIGGATGDVLGAACELAETALVLLFTVRTDLPL